jgi:hypothetical protein
VVEHRTLDSGASSASVTESWSGFGAEAAAGFTLFFTPQFQMEALLSAVSVTKPFTLSPELRLSFTFTPGGPGSL